MDETSAPQEKKEGFPDPKLFGLPRSLAGVLIGTFLFTVILLLFWMTESILFFALIFPGAWGVNMVGLSSNTLPISDFTYDVLTYSISYVISCLPPAFLGSLFVSTKKEIRTNAIILLLIYFAALSFSGFFWLYLFLD